MKYGGLREHYYHFGQGHQGNGRSGAKLRLPNGKPTTEARAYLKTLSPGVRSTILADARKIATSRNRAYVTRQMCVEAHDTFFAEPAGD